jgi:hypothetical protein
MTFPMRRRLHVSKSGIDSHDINSGRSISTINNIRRIATASCAEIGTRKFANCAEIGTRNFSNCAEIGTRNFANFAKILQTAEMGTSLLCKILQTLQTLFFCGILQTLQIVAQVYCAKFCKHSQKISTPKSSPSVPLVTIRNEKGLLMTPCGAGPMMRSFPR